MLRIPGDDCSDLCDSGVITRRDLLRVGGSGFMGLTLGSIFEMQALAKEAVKTAPGWAKAKNIDPVLRDLCQLKVASMVGCVF